MNVVHLEGGSFRDPSGHVYEVNGEILRTVTRRAADHYEFVRATGLLESLSERGLVVGSEETATDAIPADGLHKVLRHPKLTFVSYPYEWSFPLLKAAALLHLDIQIEALDRDVALSDASAYNVQFVGPRPVFIDVLSFRRYSDGEFWSGHRQFCEQFLNPLLLRSIFGVPHNAWYRGNLEGIPTPDVARIMPWWSRLSFTLQAHVLLPAKMQAKAIEKQGDLAAVRRRGLPKSSYRSLLVQLRHKIQGLEPRDTGRTVWGDYEHTHTYDSSEEQAKKRFVAAFCEAVKPKLLWDVGCNTGEYSEVALSAGAGEVVGFDFDQGALERAYARASHKALPLLPLFQDAANQSPDQGWNGSERKGLANRAQADGLLALAFEHHLAIGRNVPLDRVVDWLVSHAPRGVVEFVQKSDPTVQRMLALREDIFDRYEEAAFESALAARARIVRSEVVSTAGRKLYWFDRS
ncbi:MAG TPA: class I SAM-dependent methyltransferase [Microvirga sp.]|nr:class I SAM-dependent methyltransferase [Microvirga sp.]